MPYEDKTLLCLECGTEFEHSAESQKRLADRGFYSEPRLCPACRERHRIERAAAATKLPPLQPSRRAPRPLYPAVCAACGKPTQVPFKPAANRAVYCRDCHHLRRMAANESS